MADRHAGGERAGRRIEGGGNPLSVVVGVVVSVLIPERARDCRSAVARSLPRSAMEASPVFAAR